MIIYSKKKDFSTNSYITGFLNERQGISQILEVSKEYIELFDLYPNDLTQKELEIGVKIRNKSDFFLKDCGRNLRGGNFQKLVKNKGEIKVLGGGDIQSYFVKGNKGYISKTLDLKQDCHIQENSVLMQRLIAHIENPSPHIKMTGTIIHNSSGIAILDTIYQIICKEQISNYYVLALLHSRFLNWYCYRFVFAKAIRTFQFSIETAKRIPIPKITQSNQSTADKIIALVEEILALKESDPKADTQELEQEINSLVHTLYNLTEEEITILKEGK